MYSRQAARTFGGRGPPPLRKLFWLHPWLIININFVLCPSGWWSRSPLNNASSTLLWHSLLKYTPSITLSIYHVNLLLLSLLLAQLVSLLALVSSSQR